MRARLLVVLLSLVAVPVLAGCVSAPEPTVPASSLDALGPRAGLFHDAAGALVDPVRAEMAAAVGGGFDIGTAATEPTIGVTSSGAVFMTGFTDGVRGRAPTVLRSVDGGQSWEDKGPKLPDGSAAHATTNDPYVYVDPATDRVFMLDLIGTACSFLSWSDDEGDSWTVNPFACGTPGGNDHQTMVAASPRLMPTTLYPNVVYYCVNRVADTACATSLDGGLTFTPLRSAALGLVPGQQVEGMPFPVCGGTSGHLKAAPDGTVYLPKALCSIQPSPPVVLVTEDDGLTWETRVINTDLLVEGHEVAVAVDDDNNVYATWQSAGLHYFAASMDAGRTWTDARLVTPPGVTATEFNAIAAGAPGRVAFAYIGSTVEGGYEGKGTGNAGLAGDLFGQPPLPEWDAATWNGYIGIVTDALSPDFVVQTVTVNDPADPLARGLCGHTRCHGMNDFIDMVLDSEGRPWVAFVDVCHAECVAAEKPMSDGARGLAGTLLSGPSLRGDVGGMLSVLAAQARTE